MFGKRAITFILSLFIIYGLICGFLFALNIDLTCTSVVPGLISMDMFKDGNFQFNMPVNDPYIFTDIYTFHLLPQYLSGFDPAVIRLTAFAMFVFVLLVFTYIVNKYSDIVNALIFAALLSNITYTAYDTVLFPSYQVGTILATGILILMFDPRNIKKQMGFNCPLMSFSLWP